MQDIDIERRNYEAVELVGFSRYDYELESIFKFLLNFKVCFLIQYECMMACNMSVLYVLTKRKSLPNIDGIRVVCSKVALIPVVSFNETILRKRGQRTCRRIQYTYTNIITYRLSGTHVFNAAWAALHILRERINVLCK
jgi:hypothetical protein